MVAVRVTSILGVPPLLRASLLLLVVCCAGRGDDRTERDAGSANQARGQLDIWTGYDPRSGQSFRDIPSSSYEAERIDDDVTGAPGSETRLIYIGNAMSGEYTLHVVGTNDAPYHLELRGVDRELNPSAEQFLDIDIETDSDHRYVIEYSSEPGKRIEARRD